MKSYKPTAVCAVLCSVALVSCESDRVNERPLGSSPRPIPQFSDTPQDGSSILGDIQSQNPDSGASSISDPGSNSGTISQLLNNIGGNSAPTQAANNNLINPPQITPPQPVTQPKPQARPVSDSIPTAWAIPGDPTIVRSPYDSTKKIRIVDKTGKPYPPGTVLRDTNFPNEMRKFRVP